MSGPLMRKVLRANGTVEELAGPQSSEDIHRLIGADVLDTFTTRDREHVVFVDDLGHQKGLPINVKATALYHERCRPGTTHTIVGDAVILPNGDFP